MVKQQLLEYLTSKGVDADPKMTVPMLKKMAQDARGPPTPPLQELLNGTPHKVLQLPPYHPHYNPIELVWGIIKRHYDAHVGRHNDYSEKMCLTILDEAIATVTPQVWDRCVTKVESNIFQDYFSHVPRGSHAIKPFIIHLGDDDDDDEDDDDLFEEDVDDPQSMDIGQTAHGDFEGEVVDGDILDEVQDPTATPFQGRSLFQNDIPQDSIQGELLHEDSFGLGLAPSNDSMKEVEDATTEGIKTPLTTPNNNDLQFVPAETDVSLQWSYIPQRNISQDETHLAVSSIELESNGCSILSEILQSTANLDLECSHENEIYSSVCHEHPSHKDDTCTLTFLSEHSPIPHCNPSNDNLESVAPATPLKIDGSAEEMSWKWGSAVASTPLKSNFEVSPNRTAEHIESAVCRISRLIQGPQKQDVVFIRRPQSDRENDVILLSDDEGADLQDLPSTTDLTLQEVLCMPESTHILKRNKIQLSVINVKSLQGCSWVDGTIIDIYCSLLMESFNVFAMNTSFFPKLLTESQDIARWTKNVDLFSFETILVPIHLRCHWALCAVNFQDKRIQYYDSMEGKNMECMQAIKKYLCDEYHRKKKSSILTQAWSLDHPKKVPRHFNSHDCGVFVMAFSRCLAEKRNFSFDCNDMLHMRSAMTEEILRGKLLDGTLPREELPQEEENLKTPDTQRKRKVDAGNALQCISNNLMRTKLPKVHGQQHDMDTIQHSQTVRKKQHCASKRNANSAYHGKEQSSTGKENMHTPAGVRKKTSDYSVIGLPLALQPKAVHPPASTRKCASSHQSKKTSSKPPSGEAVPGREKRDVAIVEVKTAMDGVFLYQSARLSQKSTKFEANGNAQCTAIAAYAIGRYCIKPPPWSRADMDQIVIEGDKYYTQCKNNTNEVFLNVEDLIPGFRVCDKEVCLSFDVCGAGDFKASSEKELALVISNAMLAYKKDIGKLGFLFIGHTKTVAIIPIEETRFFYFNSHCINSNNRFEQNILKGAARLFRCLSPHSLAACTLCDHPRDFKQWNLVAVQVHF